MVVIAVDPGDPEVMRRPPRDPKLPITNRAAITAWVHLRGGRCSSPRSCRWSSGPTSRAPTTASVSMTMTFVVMGLGTIFNALTNRRDPASGLEPRRCSRRC